MSDDRRPSTADIARASEDTRGHRPDDLRGHSSEAMRGHRDEAIVNRPDLLEQPKPATAPQPPRRPAPAVRREPPREALKGDGLFAEQDAADLRQRWSDIQTAFVDEPRRSVEQADSLVAEVMQRLAEGFANERGSLERQWDRGDNVTTEDLRVALQRYRSFIDRLLSA
jgi:hypothetical protein